MANSDYTVIQTGGPLCTVANLVTALAPLDQTVIFNSLVLASSVQPAVGMGVMIDEEILKITFIDDNHFTADRGCADTIPAAHDAESVIWFYETGYLSDKTAHAATQTVSVKVIPYSNSDQVPVTSTPPHQLKFNFRFARPYAPGNFKINGQPWFGVNIPTIAADGDSFSLAWKHRDRVVQADQLIGHLAENIGPELGTTYTIHIYDSLGNLIKTRDGITGTALTYTFAMIRADLANFAAAGVKPFVFLFCSTRDGLDSSAKYMFTVNVDTGTVSQPLGLGYRLGQYLGGRTGGSGGGTPDWPNLHIVMVMGSKIFAATSFNLFVSTDGGVTFTLASTPGNSTVTQDYYPPVNASVGSQRLSIYLNGHASLSAMLVGTDDPTVAPVEYKNNNAISNWQDVGYPRAGSTPIGAGALFSDGSNYFIVGRIGANTQPVGTFYLYKADTTLNFVLQGQMTVDPTDPNALPANNYGGFSSYWFVPNDPSDAQSNISRLNKSGSRWFLSNQSAIYYSDDAAGLSNWRRCPTGLGETANNPPIVMNPPIFSGSYVIATKGFDLLNPYALSVSADNGATWTPQYPIPANNFPNYYGISGAIMLGSKACVYFDNTQNNTVPQVITAVAPFTTWVTHDVVGLPTDAVLNNMKISGGNIVGTFNSKIYYSPDGINFTASSVPAPT